MCALPRRRKVSVWSSTLRSPVKQAGSGQNHSKEHAMAGNPGARAVDVVEIILGQKRQPGWKRCPWGVVHPMGSKAMPEGPGAPGSRLHVFRKEPSVSRFYRRQCKEVSEAARQLLLVAQPLAVWDRGRRSVASDFPETERSVSQRLANNRLEGILLSPDGQSFTRSSEP